MHRLLGSSTKHKDAAATIVATNDGVGTTGTAGDIDEAATVDVYVPEMLVSDTSHNDNVIRE